MIWVAGAVLFWALAWAVNNWLASSQARHHPVTKAFVPILFGIAVFALWEGLTRGLNISAIILPPPSAILARISTSLPTLWRDFVETILKGGLSGYAIGCVAAFATAIAIDRSPFLQRGLLPIGNFVAALPIVGLAPILVALYGFGWESKAAVVVVMVFFPMLINTVEGLRAAEAMQRDLMRTYAASYWQTMVTLRLPAAAPFIFNGLKICTTLALIGAIVAEYFGSPRYGMGFRISTEVGRLNIDMVWAEIAVAAMAGSAFYGLVTLLERAATFWHPSQRG